MSAPRILIHESSTDHETHLSGILQDAGFDVLPIDEPSYLIDLADGSFSAAFVDSDASPEAAAEGMRALAQAGTAVFAMSSLFLGETNRAIAIRRDGCADLFARPVEPDEVLGWLRRVYTDDFPTVAGASDVTRDRTVDTSDRALVFEDEENPTTESDAGVFEDEVDTGSRPTAPSGSFVETENEPTSEGLSLDVLRRLTQPTPMVTNSSVAIEDEDHEESTGALPLVQNIPDGRTDAFTPAVESLYDDGPTPEGPTAVPSHEETWLAEDAGPGFSEETVDAAIQVPPSLDVRSVDFAGELAEVAFPTLLAHLAYNRSTGALMLQHEDHKLLVYFEYGFALSAKSNKHNETLSEMLLAGGLISREQLQLVEDHMLRSRLPAGQAMVDLGIFTGDEIEHLLSTHLRNRILDVFAWDSGMYTFRDGSVPRSFRHDPVISPMDLIWEGVQFGTPLSVIRSRLDPHLGDPMIWLNEAPESEEMILTRSQAKLLDLVDGMESMHTLSRGGFINEDAQRFLYVLVATGFIGFNGAAQAA